MTPFEQVLDCLSNKTSFVLQGGAGSGKTETLKNILQYISSNASEKKVACITHTNLAANEIAGRSDGVAEVSTIHSFLNDVIKSYKVDQHKIIHKLFQIDEFERKVQISSDAEYAKSEHSRYKKLYEKYAEKSYLLLGLEEPKCVGKREYDKAPVEVNRCFNEKIKILNSKVYDLVQSKPYQKIGYNETNFNSLQDLTYGHDGLITIAALLLKECPKLRKILASKYDYIFVDEYQDTAPLVIEVFLEFVAGNFDVTFGLFGDSMQGIYESGVGDVDSYIASGAIKKINKSDNFRCSKQVVDFINKLRNDGLRQEVAFKAREDQSIEEIGDRQGSVTLYYAVCDSKPHANSDAEAKESYLAQLSELIEKAQMESGFKTLMLTNKAIAAKAGFSKLYDIFSDRYGPSTNENLEKVLQLLQFRELCELYGSYESKNYGEVIGQARRAGFKLENLQDKKRLTSAVKAIGDLTVSAQQAMNSAIALKLIRSSDVQEAFMVRKQRFFEGVESNSRYQEFRTHCEAGANSLSRMIRADFLIDEYEFGELE